MKYFWVPFFARDCLAYKRKSYQSWGRWAREQIFTDSSPRECTRCPHSTEKGVTVATNLCCNTSGKANTTSLTSVLCGQAYLPNWKCKRNLYWISICRPQMCLTCIPVRVNERLLAPSFMLDLIGQFPRLLRAFWLTVYVVRLSGWLPVQWLGQAHFSSGKTSALTQTHSSSLRLCQPLHLLNLKVQSGCSV